MRIAGGVIVGYLVMAVLVFATFTVTYLAMGTDVAFRPGNYDVTILWIAASMLLSFVAAVVGGLVCGTITRKSAGPAALAIVVVALGVAFAIPTLRAPPLPTDRGPNVGVFEAMQHARQPSWAILVTPLIGALGVLVGARFVVGRTGALGEP